MNIRKPHPDSCEQVQTIQKPNGNYKTERCYSYVGLLCEKGGTETAALRVDYCTNKTEAAEKLKKELAEVAGGLERQGHLASVRRGLRGQTREARA